jgi:hypothetical protein
MSLVTTKLVPQSHIRSLAVQMSTPSTGNRGFSGSRCGLGCRQLSRPPGGAPSLASLPGPLPGPLPVSHGTIGLWLMDEDHGDGVK